MCGAARNPEGFVESGDLGSKLRRLPGTGHIGLRCPGAEPAVQVGVNAVPEPMALDGLGEVLPASSKADAGRGPCSDQHSDVGRRIDGGAACQPIDLALAAPLTLTLGGESVGGPLCVGGDPPIGVTAGGPQPLELEFDALDVGAVSLDVLSFGAGRGAQLLSFASVAPAERCGAGVELVGPS
jgi:hypothetical protein